MGLKAAEVRMQMRVRMRMWHLDESGGCLVAWLGGLILAVVPNALDSTDKAIRRSRVIGKLNQQGHEHREFFLRHVILVAPPKKDAFLPQRK